MDHHEKSPLPTEEDQAQGSKAHKPPRVYSSSSSEAEEEQQKKQGDHKASSRHSSREASQELMKTQAMEVDSQKQEDII